MRSFILGAALALVSLTAVAEPVVLGSLPSCYDNPGPGVPCYVAQFYGSKPFQAIGADQNIIVANNGGMHDFLLLHKRDFDDTTWAAMLKDVETVNVLAKARQPNEDVYGEATVIRLADGVFNVILNQSGPGTEYKVLGSYFTKPMAVQK